MLLSYIPDSNHTVKYSNLHEDVKTEQKGGKIKQRNMILIYISERTLFIKENKKEMRPAWLTKSITVFVFIIKTWNGKQKKNALVFMF